ncbi:MAG TPA: hypothetical protein VIM71_02245 [Lacunisphaera sp.]
MKTKQHEVGLVHVAAPAESPRPTVTERRSAAHLSDPLQHWQHPAAAPDMRVRAEFERAPQRVRARQTEPRTAEDCHARRPRRPPPQESGTAR